MTPWLVNKATQCRVVCAQLLHLIVQGATLYLLFVALCTQLVALLLLYGLMLALVILVQVIVFPVGLLMLMIAYVPAWLLTGGSSDLAPIFTGVFWLAGSCWFAATWMWDMTSRHDDTTCKPDKWDL